MKNNIMKIALIFLFLSAGCAAHQTTATPEREVSPPPVAPPPPPATPGSLWTKNQGSLFYDIKARNMGDIVTVAIYEQASASKEASTSSGRDSSVSADITKFFGFERDISNIRGGAADPTNLISAGFSNDFSGSGKTSRKEDLIATLTTRVTEVLPNGNMRIEGGKTVTVNNENQFIRLAGIVRPADISPENVVNSQYILDANIEYTGNGIISDKQRPGWMVRVIDNVWPF